VLMFSCAPWPQPQGVKDLAMSMAVRPSLAHTYNPSYGVEGSNDHPIRGQLERSILRSNRLGKDSMH